MENGFLEKVLGKKKYAIVNWILIIGIFVAVYDKVSYKYRSQLGRLKASGIDVKLRELNNRKGVVFCQHNARPHISLLTQLSMDVLLHHQYSFDLSHSN